METLSHCLGVWAEAPRAWKTTRKVPDQLCRTSQRTGPCGLSTYHVPLLPPPSLCPTLPSAPEADLRGSCWGALPVESPGGGTEERGDEGLYSFSSSLTPGVSLDSRSLLPSRWQILHDSAPKFQSLFSLSVPSDLRMETLLPFPASDNCTVACTLPKGPFINNTAWDYPGFEFTVCYQCGL